MKDYNIIDKRETRFSKSEICLIQEALPDKFYRNGRNRELCVSKEKDGYKLWYGTIISGNYVSESPSLMVAINQLCHYVNTYKESIFRKIYVWFIKKLTSATST